MMTREIWMNVIMLCDLPLEKVHCLCGDDYTPGSSHEDMCWLYVGCKFTSRAFFLRSIWDIEAPCQAYLHNQWE